MRRSRRDRCGSREQDGRVHCWSGKNCVLSFFFVATIEADAVLLFLDDTVQHLQHLVLLGAEPVHLLLSPPLLFLLFSHYCVIEWRL